MRCVSCITMMRRQSKRLHWVISRNARQTLLSPQLGCEPCDMDFESCIFIEKLWSFETARILPIVIVDEVEEDLFISSLASEEVCVDQRGEVLPVWTPPTPPRENSDELKLRKDELWMHNYETQPMQIKHKPDMQPKQKSEYDLPVSFFIRSGKNLHHSATRKAATPKPQSPGQFSTQKWLYSHDWALLWAHEGTLH